VSENLREQLVFLPDYLRGHLVLTLAAMSVSILISIPLGMFASQYPRFRGIVLTSVNIVQTVPSLAILAIIVALLGGMIGFLPAFLALVLYSMLPIVRNTTTGIEGAPSDAVQAATAIGMTPTQVLLKVKLPLALPVIVAGVRTATVWTVGLATLSTLVGATSLGNYIFIGIQTRNLTAVTIGSISSALLAILLDGAVGGLQILVQRRPHLITSLNRRALAIGSAVIVAVLVAGGVRMATAGRADYIVGGKAFTEQYILAELFARQLRDAGFSVDVRTGLGSDMTYAAARQNSVDVYLEYTGTVWANHMHREDNPGRVAVRDGAIAFMKDEDGIVTIGPAGFENLYAFAMRKDRAAELGVDSIDDLIGVADQLTCGADLEFFGRPEWIRVRDTYGIDFGEKLTFDAALMYTAVNERQVDIITAYTTDGRVAAYDLLLLDDPREALLPYDGLIVASPRAAEDPKFRAALEPLAGNITDETMREANKIVDVDGRPIGEAVEFIVESINNR